MILKLAAVLFLASGMALAAQESSIDLSPRPPAPISLEELPGLRERAIVMRIVSMIVDENQAVVWDSENTRVTMPGRPVGIQLEGSDLVVVVQFTPFLRPNGRHVLVALGQIWINIPNEGISYNTTLQTIPLEFNETVYFFPLGSMDADDEARIEIQLTLEPYISNDSPAGMGRGNGAQYGRNR